MPSRLTTSPSSHRPVPGSRCSAASSPATPAPKRTSRSATATRKRTYPRGTGSQPMKNSSPGTCDMVWLLEAGRLDRGARRQRLGVEQDAPFDDAQAVGRDALGERGRRLAVLRPILPAVPRTGDTAVHDL